MASRQLYHERRAVGGGSEFASGIGAEGRPTTPVDYAALPEAGHADNERVQQIAGRALVYRAVSEQLIDHVYHGVNDGSLPPAAGSIIRISTPNTSARDGHRNGDRGQRGRRRRRRRRLLRIGERYLSRQSASLGGGTTEIARNIIAERILGLPREYAADRGVPFKDVKRNRG